MKKVLKIRPFLPLTVFKVEEWLKEESISGYRLVYNRWWLFWFEECASKEREYFAYASVVSKRQHFMMSFLNYKCAYQLKKSPLNKKTCGIFEIDPKKKDELFEYCSHERTDYYLKHYKKINKT